MANSKNSGNNYEYATVNTAPAVGGGGFYTNPVFPKRYGKPVYFSIRDTTDDSSPSSIVVKLQFKCPDDTGWTDHLNSGSNWGIGDRVRIDDSAANVQWRAGVVDDSDYTSGSVTFGFDW
jgi:hypothetical protein